MRDLVTRAIQDRSKLIGHALAPVLRAVEPADDRTLNAELGKFSSDGTVLKLMPVGAGGGVSAACSPAPCVGLAIGIDLEKHLVLANQRSLRIVLLDEIAGEAKFTQRRQVRPL